MTPGRTAAPTGQGVGEASVTDIRSRTVIRCEPANVRRGNPHNPFRAC